MKPGAISILTGLTVLASLLFYFMPQIDLIVSGIFQKDGGFLLEKGTRAALTTDLLHYGMRAAFVGYMVVGGLALAFNALQHWFSWRRYLFVVMSVAVAAGLLTNVILKDHWGRARPAQIVEFGGTKRFTPAWAVSDQCGTNCSFVGGDVSFAFCSLSLALTARRKRFWTIAAISFGMLVALARVAAGGHFLSDCILATLLTSLVILLLDRFIFHNITYATEP